MDHRGSRGVSVSSDSDDGQEISVAMFQAPNATVVPSKQPTSVSVLEVNTVPVPNATERRDLEETPKEHVVGLRLPPVSNRERYIEFHEDKTIRRILRELDDPDVVEYEVKFEDMHVETITYEKLITFENGRRALTRYLEQPLANQTDSQEGGSDSSDSVIEGRHSTRISISSSNQASRSKRPTRRVALRNRSASKALNRHPISDLDSEEDASEAEIRDSPRRLTRRGAARRDLRSAHKYSNRSSEPDIEDQSDVTSSDDVVPELQSDVLPQSRKRKRGQVRIVQYKPDREHNGMKFDKPRRSDTRRSHRSTRNQTNMEEVGLEAVYRSDSDHARPIPKAVGAREAFQPLPRSSTFVVRHNHQCDTCGTVGSNARGQLVYCQGCTLTYHKSCLGVRSTRDHIVTKIGEGNFVLQCRRCIGLAKKRDHIAPDQGICQVCRAAGAACRPFRGRKTPAQEERDREENGGEDPITPVNESKINNPSNLLFRCTSCWRGFHFHHLLPRDETKSIDLDDDERIAAKRAEEYCGDWLCNDCKNMPAKIGGLVAWRPVDPERYTPGQATQEVIDDIKEYLIKWEGISYFRALWMPGAWTWGVTATAMRAAFAKRNNGNNLPMMRTEDAIPEEFLRVDVVLDVKFTSRVDTRMEEVDKARIREVDQAYIKYKGLGYEDAVWEKPPEPEELERWSDFVTAYDDWVRGRYVKIPKALPLKIRLEKHRSQEFNILEKKKQPDSLVGGELMKYQLDGLNWLYYRWYLLQNGILADEMGLGKTIQIIGLLATLFEDHNCFPFLIVVPNSTCPNWRREIKRWAPSLRVVTFYGVAAARSKSYQYELFPEGAKELRCHVVVTSYDTAADDNCRKFFKSVPWQGLIVDEGQRLKNDRNLLYNALAGLKVPFRLLLTGTPLQNNARELFNLLQFLDDSFDAAALELEYSELTNENVPRLHDLIRPFFLRRTKAQVLTFLPPMAQIIIPVSMSVLQRKLYSSILAKNPDLIRAIFNSNRELRQSERSNLNNILAQLRKCLCHPFVYSKSIEERSLTPAISHRNLVEASGKLQLLELLLPKLRERGHRVLIFSQFLDMLDIIEDFLDGLELRYHRLDGLTNTLQKQKRIDEFNAPDSPLFAFLLSTRAGGVGINLATADTVIILDPDFNPHQDIQALSRAHRIGQKKKVLCFQLMTRGSAEERIMQIGRKKMAHTHIMIERMDANDDAEIDTESVLRYGAAEILSGNTQDHRYDDASVEKLLDRSQIENTQAGNDNTAESQFSFARVWENDAASMMDSLGSSDEDEKAPDPTVWEKILKEREIAAAEEAAARSQVLGRGQRARQAVDYSKSALPLVAGGHTDSDTDFQGGEAEESHDDEEMAIIPPDEIEGSVQMSPRQPFRRAQIVWPSSASQRPIANQASVMEPTESVPSECIACGSWHQTGYCPFKLAGVEYCNLCGIAHFGVEGARVCPHVRSETQVSLMLTALKASPESQHLVSIATKYLRGVKGTIVQDKKAKAKAHAAKDVLAGGLSSTGMSDYVGTALLPTAANSIPNVTPNGILSGFPNDPSNTTSAELPTFASQSPQPPAPSAFYPAPPV